MRAAFTTAKKKAPLGATTRYFELVGALSNPTLAHWLQAPSLTFYLTVAVLLVSLVLGGGTRGGFLSDFLLQLLTLPALLYLIWKLGARPLTRQTKVALTFCLALVALPLLQLVPLPPWLWESLPSGELSSLAIEITGQAAPWMSMSVSPQATLLVLLSLIPPLAVFLGAVQLTFRERRWLSVVLIGFGVVSVFMGLVQVAQGPQSALRFFEITNPSEAVGFFANRNHFAALVYCVILFAAARTIPTATAVGTKLSERQFEVGSMLKAIAAFTILVVLIAGEAMARSRAGLALTMVGLFGALALGLTYQTVLSLRTDGLRERFIMKRIFSLSPTKILGGAIAFAVVFSLQYALYRIQERFEADPVDDARLVFLSNTIEATKTYLPLGSGLGSFVSVYPMFEKAEGMLANKFANHAHNDFFEASLETGIFGLVLMGLFVIWLAYRSAAAWTGPIPRGGSESDQMLARAATIAIVVLLAHTFVDYPLRTGAMMAVMAFACALLIEPPATAEGKTERRVSEDAHFTDEARLPVPRLARSTSQPVKTRELSTTRKPQWGSDINWPKEWTTTDDNKGPPRKQ